MIKILIKIQFQTHSPLHRIEHPALSCDFCSIFIITFSSSSDSLPHSLSQNSHQSLSLFCSFVNKGICNTQQMICPPPSTITSLPYFFSLFHFFFVFLCNYIFFQIPFKRDELGRFFFILVFKTPSAPSTESVTNDFLVSESRCHYLCLL